MSIPVIDLFAGPGGLGEGFSSFTPPAENPPRPDCAFEIGLSIEKDVYAHRTLELRSFFRKFPAGEAPEEYYRYLRGGVTRDELFASHPLQAEAARREAWKAELGGRGYAYSVIDARIERALNGRQRWVLVGGPPCQAYSLAGRSRMRGTEPHERLAFDQDRRHLLYKQYLRIIARHRPTIFIMENVKGILSSTVGGDNIFTRILNDLRNPTEAADVNDENQKALTYNIFPLACPMRLVADGDVLPPSDYVVKSEDFGIPQARHRVFLLGVRAGIGIEHGEQHYLARCQERVTVEQVLGDLPPLRSQISRGGDTLESWQQVIRSVATQEWLREDNFARFEAAIRAVTENVNGHLLPGGEWQNGEYVPEHNPDNWYSDPRLQGVNHHTTRGHLAEDLKRYLFAAVYAQETGRSPTLNNFPVELLPRHGNVTQAIENGSLFSDRFRVQLRNRPSTTVMSHISKDGHYFIHFDPGQCRSLTVREAARLQTFPDNYFFEGPRTHQYHQVGNAVPPLLAKQIAAIVYDMMEGEGGR